MKVFPDTNVLLSAFFGVGLCSRLFEALLRGGHEVVIGEPVAREFIRVAREKFQVEPERLAFALEVLRRLTPAPNGQVDVAGVPDPDDVPILSCAVAAGTEIFVTGDKALLEMKPIKALEILSPRQCWERVFPAG